jgi:NAD(P)-dependent dehydrogenase (short-subunit alcohol dehydrogenase family)
MFQDAFDLSSKLAVVTGGAQGIGRAICEALGECRARLVVADYDLAVGEKAAAELRAADLDAQFVLLDVRDRNAVATPHEASRCGGEPPTSS